MPRAADVMPRLSPFQSSLERPSIDIRPGQAQMSQDCRRDIDNEGRLVANRMGFETGSGNHHERRLFVLAEATMLSAPQAVGLAERRLGGQARPRHAEGVCSIARAHRDGERETCFASLTDRGEFVGAKDLAHPGTVLEKRAEIRQSGRVVGMHVNQNCGAV